MNIKKKSFGYKCFTILVLYVVDLSVSSCGTVECAHEKPMKNLLYCIISIHQHATYNGYTLHLSNKQKNLTNHTDIISEKPQP